MITRGAFLLPFLLLASCAPSTDSSLEGDAAGVVYGEDSRGQVDANDVNIPLVAAFLPASRLTVKPGTKMMEVENRPLSKKRFYCPENQFLNENSAAVCTGFLIAPDRVLTAGHCVAEERYCTNVRLVFGWTPARQGMVPESSVFHCKKVLKLEIDWNVITKPDYAIVELDRPVELFRPMVLDPKPWIVGEELVLYGHPDGVPMKRSAGRVREILVAPDSARAELDTFHGDSGAAVLSPEGAVRGIIVAGEDDYVLDEQRDCWQVKRCGDGECSGEQVMSLGAVDPNFLPTESIASPLIIEDDTIAAPEASIPPALQPPTNAAQALSADTVDQLLRLTFDRP